MGAEKLKQMADGLTEIIASLQEQNERLAQRVAALEKDAIMLKPELMCSTKTAAGIMGVTVNALYNMCARGQITYYQPYSNGKIRFYIPDLMQRHEARASETAAATYCAINPLKQ